MPIARRLNMADNAFPTSQWTEAGATRIAPRVSRTRPAFSGCSPTTAKIADVSITISTIAIIQHVQLYNNNSKLIGAAITTVAGMWKGPRRTPLWNEIGKGRSRVLEPGGESGTDCTPTVYPGPYVEYV